MHNESDFYFQQEFSKRKGNWKVFYAAVKDKFAEYGFEFKQPYKNATHFTVNGIPVYFESSGSSPFYLIFYEYATDFPKKLKKDLDENLKMTRKFSSVKKLVDFFNENLIHLYANKKLKHLKDFGIF